jgi:NAD(P)-dependent dehydrogenase (short-subunit alcohol dehydrogenase family)
MILNSKRKIMKVAITGHTNGIGQGLYNYFQKRGHDVCGFSRSNGFVLPDAESQVLDQIKECDIFINNALPVSSQIFLLKELWPQWECKDKKIIVISSVASHLPYVWEELKDYQQEKKELDNLCRNLRYKLSDSGPEPQCSLISIHPGFVATNIFADLKKQHPPENWCMSVAQVVNVVDYVLSSPVKIDDIVFRR